MNEYARIENTLKSRSRGRNGGNKGTEENERKIRESRSSVSANKRLVGCLAIKGETEEKE